MASIRQRIGRWQARVSRKGYPAETNTFDSHGDAVKWARALEIQMDRGFYVNKSTAEQLTLKDALGRYAKEVTPMKRGAKEEGIRINALQRRKFTNHSLATLTPKVLADFRDERGVD